ncbi:uncharacterized protein LOC144366627 [Ictidomys tridecemlineatus]
MRCGVLPWRSALGATCSGWPPERTTPATAMCPPAPGSLLLVCSLAVVPLVAVSWEIKMSDFEEKDIDEFASNGFRCPTCFAVKGRLCKAEFKWCATDRTQCVEFSGVIDTGFSKVPIELKKCAQADQCTETITTYMGFPVSNESKSCRSPFGTGTRVRTTPPIFFVFFLGKLIH